VGDGGASIAHCSHGLGLPKVVEMLKLLSPQSDPAKCQLLLNAIPEFL
jgi:hypothetical protein